MNYTELTLYPQSELQRLTAVAKRFLLEHGEDPDEAFADMPSPPLDAPQEVIDAIKWIECCSGYFTLPSGQALTAGRSHRTNRLRELFGI